MGQIIDEEMVYKHAPKNVFYNKKTKMWDVKVYNQGQVTFEKSYMKKENAIWAFESRMIGGQYCMPSDPIE